METSIADEVSSTALNLSLSTIANDLLESSVKKSFFSINLYLNCDGCNNFFGSNSLYRPMEMLEKPKSFLGIFGKRRFAIISSGEPQHRLTYKEKKRLCCRRSDYILLQRKYPEKILVC